MMATLFEILQTRAGIVATEFEEEWARLREMVVFAILALFLVGTGLLLLTLFVVVWYWDTHRLAVLAWLASLYLSLGGLVSMVLYRRIKSRPRLFATTLSELAKDRERIGARP